MPFCRQTFRATSTTNPFLTHGGIPLQTHPIPTVLYLPGPLLSHRLLRLRFRAHQDKKGQPFAVAAAFEATAADAEEEEEDEEEDEGKVQGEDHRSLVRKQNARSAAVLGFLKTDHNDIHEKESAAIEEEEDVEEQRKQRMLEELSVVGRRKPRFPGSIDFPKAGDGAITVAYSPRSSNSRVLAQALEVRRGVAAEILKEVLKASKFSITYSTNLVSGTSGFVDQALIEAAALKGNAEFSHLSFNARVKSFIHSSGVIPLIKWLKHNGLSYPQIGKAICMCASDLHRLRRRVEWLKSIHVKGELLGAVLTKAQKVVDRSIDELDEIVDCLQRNGLRKDWIGFVVSRCPQVLALSMEELECRVKFYMVMGMNQNDFGTMVYDYPKVLGFFSLQDMKDKVSYLQEFGLTIDEVGRLLAYKPQLMGCSIQERWKPLVKYLYYLGVQRDGMKRILMVKPMVFCVDLETTIAPKVRFLQDIGVHEEAIGRVLVKFPPILTYSLYKKIRPVVIFLMTKAGVTRKDIGKVIALEPELVGCSIVDKLDINVKYFLSLGIPVKSLGEMIADFPMLLRYNLDILRPKYRYLRRIMVRPLQDLIEFPRFFSYSLDGRIIPRHKILIENRINFKLRYMLAGSDEDFDRRVKLELQKRQSFESVEVNMPINSECEATQTLPVAGREVGV